MPQELSSIDNVGSNFSVHSAKAGEGLMLYSTDVGGNPPYTEGIDSRANVGESAAGKKLLQ